MKSVEIRQKFFNYFKKQGHTHVASSSLIPAQDPTLLFANAGMNQFKDIFLGLEKRSYRKAVSIQKCIRAGGKHNDLDNVGFTKRHLTFFEMMGNFSFGDYFKKEAIHFAWEFLTQEIKLNPELLYASVYKLDDEAYDIWHKNIGLPKNRIVRLGQADNFWQMGDTGPCGPCTEIYYDRGFSDNACPNAAECAPGCSCDRFLEIWNLVFMQFNRQQDGTDMPLTQTGVDTGMGLERLCAVVQGKDTVYDTDLFLPIIQATEKLTGITYEHAPQELQAAFRVLADHIRSSTFAIADGCTPANDGRGYVLRKIIRRAALFAQKLSDKNIFPELADTVINEFGNLYPELIAARSLIKQLLTAEIEKFSLNLINGQSILKNYFTQQTETPVITGEQAFKLYDTYGFPLELTHVIAHEQGFTVDSDGFKKAMEQQRLQSGKKVNVTDDISIPEEFKTVFTGYDELITSTQIIGLIFNNELVAEVPEGELCLIITEKSPLYVECGGQVNDTALMMVGHRQAEIIDIKKMNKAIAFSCIAPTRLIIDQQITICVKQQTRLETMKNHTATHLLQAALQIVLGDHIKQSGSLVTPDYLRFDFTHHAPLTLDEVTRIEDIINNKIMENIPLSITNSTYKAAVEAGVIAFFGEKYNPDNVRVVQIPGFSAELCGGTHVRATGDIGSFKITENIALSAGNRRIVALTGPKALALFQQDFNLIKKISQELKVPSEQLARTVEAQKHDLQEALRTIKQFKKELFRTHIPKITAQAIKLNHSTLFHATLSEASLTELKEYAELLLSKEAGIVLLTSVVNNKQFVFLAVSDEKLCDMKKVADWMKTQGIKGGGTQKHFQGSTDKPLVDLAKNFGIFIDS
ncbi:MAG: alanine--tRNA ligase [Candidatus Babeliaceae bacterium]|nr:alanine--tRNA ligase [Candidatus Babeliaceae bacterium]